MVHHYHLVHRLLALACSHTLLVHYQKLDSNRSQLSIDIIGKSKASILLSPPLLPLQVRHVYFERFTVAEQLAMAADSDLIVAAHGGGEGWMTVMPRDSALVELRFSGNSNCFAPFAKWAKVRGSLV
jgi:hypothetical protein